ncbi:MAG: 5'-nucleotidase C-terminal domain-containing protein [Negativicutes bacterium]|jgi:2',3'-cyclic-nucleotide 2'-phosphodiesterase/3'-nucleotidase
MKRSLFCTLIMLSFLLLSFSVGQAETTGNDVLPIQVLTVNDFHGALMEDENNPGAAKLAGYLLSKRADNPDRTLLLSAGDMMQGTMASNLLFGSPDIAIMNYLNFDAMALGNHEFDWSITKVYERQKQADFPFLAANIFYKGTANVPDFCVPTAIITRGGVKVGIIGYATIETPQTTIPTNVSDYIFTDQADNASVIAQRLRRQGCDIVIVLSHMGLIQTGDLLTGEAVKFANKVKGIDLIVCGHTHKVAKGYVNGIPLVEAFWSGRAAGVVTLNYSVKQKRIISSVIEVADTNTIRAAKPDTGVLCILNRDLAAINVVSNRVIGYSANGLRNEKNSSSIIESQMGQFVTDTMRTKAKVAVAFMNAGALRVPFDPGKITLGNVYSVMPFDNTLVTLSMTGAQILAVLNYGIGKPNMGAIQFSGLAVTYDSNKPYGSAVKKVSIGGKPLDLTQKYSVVTNDFCEAGGDGYTMFAQGTEQFNTGILVRDCMNEAVESTKNLEIVDDGRLTVLK